MIVRKIMDTARYDELFAIAFQSALDRSREPDCDDSILRYAAFDDDGEMMSALCSTLFSINFDGSRVKMGGIGGVATLPQYRRRGGIRSCFSVLLPELYKSGYDFSYLYPFSTDFYRKFGYENCVTRWKVRVDVKQLRAADIPGKFQLADKAHPVGAAIRQIDRLWETKYNMAVQHESAYYEKFNSLDPYVSQEFCYVYYIDGTPAAYCIFRIALQDDGRNLLCSAFRFNDRAGFMGLMEIFRRLSADHRYVKFELPVEPAMQYLFSEWSLGAAEWSIVPAGMVRVINGRNVLQNARYKGSGCVRIKIRDDLIPENCGSFAVKFKNGRLTDIAPCRKIDAAMDISVFSALIAGVCSFSEAKNCFEKLEVSAETPDLEKVFYRKPLMISDYF